MKRFSLPTPGNVYEAHALAPSPPAKEAGLADKLRVALQDSVVRVTSDNPAHGLRETFDALADAIAPLIPATDR